MKDKLRQLGQQGLAWVRRRAAAWSGGDDAPPDPGPPPLSPGEQHRLHEAWHALLERQPNDYVTLHDLRLLPAEKPQILAMLRAIWRENRTSERVQLFVLSSAEYLAHFQPDVGESRPIDGGWRAIIDAEADHYRRLLEHS